MKSVTTTYPGFHSLPKGIKQLLLCSEDYFFTEARAETQHPARSAGSWGGQPGFTESRPSLVNLQRSANQYLDTEIHFSLQLANV